MENSDQKYLYNNPDLASKEDPYLSKYILNARKNADTARSWNQLILRSTHINNLVTLAPRGKIGNWGLDLDIVNRYLRQGTLIVNMSADPFNRYEEAVVKELSNLTDDFVVLSGDATYFLEPKKHICFLPFWFLIFKYSYPAVAATDQDRSYKVSSLNGRTRYHRVENFVKLKEKPYFDQLLFTMYNDWNEQIEKRQTPKEYWNNNIVEKFNTLIPNPITPVKTDSNENPAYRDSYINYVTETSILDATIFISEKTWKPIMSGQLGIWLSNPGIINFLRAVGFDMFDDILDNHLYDNETNLNKRINMIHNVIDKIMSEDVAQIFHDTLTRRQANLDLFYSDSLEELLTAQCKEYQL